ncbi:MAG: formimidoylglutamate deiminase [Parvularculaceae bacterium]
MTTLFAKRALLPSGWAEDVRIRIGANGRIMEVEAGAARDSGDVSLGEKTILPAPGDLHSHGFQRAMAGLAEYRSTSADSFWTWRETMYWFLSALSPDDVEAVTAFAFMEMAEAGYGAVAEFHYVHNAPGGAPYDDIAEMSSRIIAAGGTAGLGLTLLPVFYAYGGANKAPLKPRQKRFETTLDSYASLRAGVARAAKSGAPDLFVGNSFHSLRAAGPEEIRILTETYKGAFHVHAAEQVLEVDDVKAWLGARPVEWILDNTSIGPGWCLVHATHMTEAETAGLARRGAVAGVCPVTEGNLGDGVFNGAAYLEAGGKLGFGTDSNISISLADELRLLEYTQRVTHKSRNVMCRGEWSAGRTLYELALEGGAAALSRASGAIAPGRWADLVTLDPSKVSLLSGEGDRILDGFVFAGGERAISDVWSGGRHIVKDGVHVRRDEIESRFRASLSRLRHEAP